jgi:hypothetical protein
MPDGGIHGRLIRFARIFQERLATDAAQFT